MSHTPDRQIVRIDSTLARMAHDRIETLDPREWWHTTDAIESLLDERLMWMRARDGRLGGP